MRKKILVIIFACSLIAGCVSVKTPTQSKPQNLQVWLSPYTDMDGNRHTAQLVEIPLEEKVTRV